jgi:hypothetical protein
VNIFFNRSGTQQSVIRTQQKSFSDEGIESRNDKCETSARGAQAAFERRNRGFRKLFDF